MATQDQRKKGHGARYAEIAKDEAARKGLPDRAAHARAVGYSEAEIKSAPEDAVMCLGCGNPLALAAIKRGETVLDLGCGGGFDAFLAARRVGTAGRVIGVDSTVEMVRKATETAKKNHFLNVEFQHASIDHLPLDDNSADVAISNCVINHCQDKPAAFREIRRVLRPGGRLHVSDLVVRGGFSEDALKDKVWGEWIGAALDREQYLAAIGKAGFSHVRVEREGLFAFSEQDPRLKGRILSLLVTARKQSTEESRCDHGAGGVQCHGNSTTRPCSSRGQHPE